MAEGERLGGAARRGSPRILVIGDVMTDVVVRPEGALARGSDRRATIRFEPGGSAANQAAWLAAFGVAVDFVARVGSGDVEAEAARLSGGRGDAASRRGSGAPDRKAGRAHRPVGRAQLLHRPRGERGARRRRHSRRRSSPARRLIHLSGYSFFAPAPRAAVLDVMRARGRDARQRRSGLLGIPARGGAAEFSRLDPQRRAGHSQRRRGRGSRPGRPTPRSSAPASPPSTRSS